jgi:hypothetical protein
MLIQTVRKSPTSTSTHRRPAGRRSPASRLCLEMLEGRCLLSAFPVLNFLDSGPGSLREAILAANSEPGADLISFAPAARDGSIALTGGQLNITDDLTIDGPGANHLTVSGNNSSRVFSISGGTTDVELSGLTIADGMATGNTVVGPSGAVTMGGGILNSGGNLTVSQVTLSNNRVVGFNGAGGAIASVLGATLSVEHGTFTGNRATGSNFGFGGGTGGGIFSDAGSTLIVAHSTFTGNQGIGSDGSAGRGGVGRGGAITIGEAGLPCRTACSPTTWPAVAGAPTVGPARTAVSAAMPWAVPSPIMTAACSDPARPRS